MPGQIYDAETGLYFNGWRTYSPQLGRYLESDPIGLNGGLNTYAYVKGNPIRYRDPRGLNPLAGAIGGAQIGTMVLPGPGTVIGAGIGLLGGYLLADQLSHLLNQMSNSNPLTGEPGSEQTCGNKKGNKKQTRRYGADGYPVTDTDWDHSHDGLGSPHAHDWGRPSDGSPPTHGDRGEGRSPVPGDPGIPR